MSDDGDKTVFGGKLPPPKQPAGRGPIVPPAAPMPGRTPPPADDKTQIGGALPPHPPRAQPGMPPAAPYPGQAPAGAPADPWGQGQPSQHPGQAGYPPPGQPPSQPQWGQPAPPQSPAFGQPAPPPGYGQPPQTPHPGGFVPPPPGAPGYPVQPGYPQQPGYPAPPPGQPGLTPGAPGIGRPTPQDQGFFPDLAQPTPTAPQPFREQIPLERALRGSGLSHGGPANPLLAAASDLLILLGRLRTGMVEMTARPLIDHVTREITDFEGKAHARGADPNDIMIAKYALCGTADDIVQNLPGADRDVWIQYSMVARFFQRRDSGVGFFQEAEKAMSAPAQKFYLLELMLVCLSLGFEGQYRALPHGAQELARIRTAIYDSLRRVAPRPDNDMSASWQPVAVGNRRRFRSTPVWVVAAIAAALLVLVYGTLSTIISRDGAQVVTTLTELHPGETIVALERSPGPAFVAPIGQVERIRQALAAEVAAGQVDIGPKGSFIFIRVGNALLFGSGSAELNPDFLPLADRIASVLNVELGPIAVIGFTDSIQPNGLGRFKTNQALSEARATAVRDVLADRLTDPDRLGVEGRGPAEPIATNDTREGRALNRRVEVMLAREGTF